MRVVVFGASGGVGGEMVRQGRERGHDVLAVARRGRPVPSGETAWLSVLDAPLEPVLDGAQGVLSGLGIRRRHVWNPWSRLTSPPDFCSRSADRIVRAMEAVGIRPLVAISAAGVGDSSGGLSPVLRGFIRSSSIGTAYVDLERMEAVYRSSAVDACCVRPVTLTHGPRTESVREVERFRSTMSISRADVAWWCWELMERGVTPGTPSLAG